MKIAIVTTLAGPGPLAGGVWEVARTQATALREANHEVKLIAGWLGKDPPQSDTITYIPLHNPVPGAGLRLLAPKGLRRKIRDLRSWADVAHVHLCRDFVTTPALNWLRGTPATVVVQTHGMLGPAHNPITKAYDIFLGKRARKWTDAYLALTISEIDMLVELGIPSHRILQIDNACSDTDDRWHLPDEPVFLFASRLQERKQPTVFVDAAIHVLELGYTASFWIAGNDQGEERAVRERIEASAHRAHFKMLGALPHDELLERLTMCTAMVLPSRHEPYPMIVLEASARGVPMIVTTEVGIARKLRESNAARLAPPTVAATAEAMIELIADQEVACEMSLQARSLYEQNWRTETLAESLKDRYTAIPGLPPMLQRKIQKRSPEAFHK